MTQVICFLVIYLNIKNWDEDRVKNAALGYNDAQQMVFLKTGDSETKLGILLLTVSLGGIVEIVEAVKCVEKSKS